MNRMFVGSTALRKLHCSPAKLGATTLLSKESADPNRCDRKGSTSARMVPDNSVSWNCSMKNHAKCRGMKKLKDTGLPCACFCHSTAPSEAKERV